MAVSGQGILSLLIGKNSSTSKFQGIYIELEDGRKVIDAVGGAAVACIGNGHPEVIKAVKDQIEKLACV